MPKACWLDKEDRCWEGAPGPRQMLGAGSQLSAGTIGLLNDDPVGGGGVDRASPKPGAPT